MVALEWLKRHYDNVDGNCWKSEYRDRVFGGITGDDSLGYDFEVFEKRKRLHFEVKATSGERPLIELGPSEIRAAQKKGSANRYRILFISNVLAPEARRILVLPNPFSESGRGYFRSVGSGVSYEFRLQE